MTGHEIGPLRERFQQRLKQFSRAADRLDDALNQPETEFVRDSVVQRFKFTFELAWKSLQAWLRLTGTDGRSPREVLGEALRQGMISDGDGWSSALEYRNITSHSYDEQGSVEICQFVRSKGIVLIRAALDHLKQKASENDPFRPE